MASRTKAETLQALAGRVKGAFLPPLERLSLAQWKKGKERFLRRVLKTSWAKSPLIVRSSARGEDAAGSLQAGKYLSVAGVRGQAALSGAIDRVFASYGRARKDDQVFVQPFLERMTIAGVAFSREPSSGGPYVVVNYDDARGGSSASVTSGTSKDAKTFYHFRGVKPSSDLLGRIVSLTLEVEKLLGGVPVDIEFAAMQNGKIALLQARPLACAGSIGDEEVKSALHLVARRIEELNRPHPYLHGKHTIFGVMPDWNPAEIIGVKPRPLALSLYKELITDSIWAYQRDNYGYKNLRSFPLMVDLHGMPYIDVRVDFNSFLPAGLDAALSEKLLSYYLNRLINAPMLHDKVEFDILFTCYTFDLPERLKALRREGLTSAEISRLTDALRDVTNAIIGGDNDGLWHKDLEKIAQLDARRAAIMEGKLDGVSRAYWLIEDVKRYGTLPFAGLARAGFIAVSLLRSLTAVGILSRAEVETFMASLDTVTSRMDEDLRALSRKEFLKIYGHLRPGTYDILSPRYDQAPERYFDFSRVPRPSKKQAPAFSLSPEQLKRTDALLREHKLDYDAVGLFDFIRAAIEARERAKFLFTRHLSDVLVLVQDIGRQHGLSAQDCSYASIRFILSAYASSASPGELLKASIEEGRRAYRVTQAMHLPPLVALPRDVWSFHLPASQPNFITLKKAAGAVAPPNGGRRALRGAIVAIPNADPGYDWIFSCGIAGLITMYGGANSHMAIRAGEVGVPAVIGAGQALYDLWSRAKALEIDAETRRVTILK